MINSNPETVSTDYDTSDLLFFEPLTLEDTLNVIETLNGLRLQIASDGPKIEDSTLRSLERRYGSCGIGDAIIVATEHITQSGLRRRCLRQRLI